MAKVHSARKNRGKKEYHCGRCGVTIDPGERYYFWEPRYGPKQIRCRDHYPRQSELTTSKMSEVYAAIEEAEDDVQQYDGEDNDHYADLIQQVKEVAENTQSEYEDAAQQFGGAGENAERAEALGEFIGELEGADFEEFQDWYTRECPEELLADAQIAWREAMAANLVEALSTVP